MIGKTIVRSILARTTCTRAMISAAILA